MQSLSVAFDTSLADDENVPILKMAERQDWALFRSIEGLCQKAGVPPDLLRRLVLKEIADNGLDTGAAVSVERLSPHSYAIQDSGPGLDCTPQEIAQLFSIRRPMRSSKLLRLPQRGALGNGLRVVAGAVLASEGKLIVTTRNRRIVLRPEMDGSTTVVEVTTGNWLVGTRVTIEFGAALPADASALSWTHTALHFPGIYSGKSSPWWYDAASFHELILAHGKQPLRALISELDGCSGGKAGEIIAAAGLHRAVCENVTRAEASTLLATARQHVRPVPAERLGQIGRNAFPDWSYAHEHGTVDTIPFVVEAWARKDGEKIALTMLVNRTPVTGDIRGYRDSDKHISMTGCGLHHLIDGAPSKGGYRIVINVLTPHCPITSDGKAPNLKPFFNEISDAVAKATRKAQRAAPGKRVSQKDIVLKNLDQAIANASGDGEYRFNERQIFYQLRPIVLEETDQPLQIGNFKAIITDYENENGEIEGMYREPRGSIYHPHRHKTIALGTLSVEEYERPIWNYNKLVYIEKEGFSEALKDNRWPERHDCAVASSKGYTTRAIKDLVDKLAEHDEPCTIYCIHDADAYGTMIYQTFQEATKARRARKIQIVNLGLEPWEAVDMDLEVEDVEQGERRKPVAEYVHEHEDGEYWEEWLQTHRVELNAMTTPEFIEWLDGKMAEHGDGKLIPPADVLDAQLAERLEESVRAAITERILRAANLERQVVEALKAINRPSGTVLAQGIGKMFNRSPEREWRDHIAGVVGKLMKKC
jgi:hypothetical protein